MCGAQLLSFTEDWHNTKSILSLQGIKYEVTYGPSGGCTQNKPEHDFYDHCFATSELKDHTIFYSRF